MPRVIQTNDDYATICLLQECNQNIVLLMLQLYK